MIMDQMCENKNMSYTESNKNCNIYAKKKSHHEYNIQP